MAKCTETCPKCGSKHVYNGWPEESWYCGSRGEYQSVPCKTIAELRSQLAAANAGIERLRAEASRARKSLDVMRRGTCNLAAAEAYAHALEITREIVHREYHPHD